MATKDDDDTRTDQDDDAAGDDVVDVVDDAQGGDDKDLEGEAAKWKAMARKHEKRAKANADAAAELAKIKDADKSEIEKAVEKAAADQRRADEAEAKALRLQVALDKSLPSDLIEFLTGTEEDELESQADKLLTRLSAAGDAGDGDTTTTRRPKPNLRPGASPGGDDDGDDDPVSLAKRIRRTNW